MKRKAAKWCGLNFRKVFGMQVIGGGGAESNKLLRMLDLPWQCSGKTSKKIEDEAGTAEQLVRDMVIEKTPQAETKVTPEKKHQPAMQGMVCFIRQQKNLTR